MRRFLAQIGTVDAEQQRAELFGAAKAEGTASDPQPAQTEAVTKLNKTE
jgi:hypothetical protein